MKLIIFSLVIFITASFTFAQESSIKRKKIDCPMDPWAVSSTPVSFLGMKNAPAKISGTGDNDLRSGFKEIWIKNLSGKTITVVKIKWFLYRVDRINNIITPRANPNIILQDETPSIEIEAGELKPDEETYIDYPIASCREIYDALVKDDDSKGEPWIEPAVIEILYADGSKWTR